MLFLFTAIFVFCFSEKAYAENISLNEIKDDVFRQYIIDKFDKDHDGSISESEAENVTNIDIRNKKIKTLEGISLFPNLISLNCAGNDITSLDMSGNPKLQTLVCEDNDISYLNITENPELLVLNCALNNLDGIDVTHNTKLESLQCAGNKSFGDIDLSKNPNLKALLYVGGSMKEIDLSHNINLESLWISTTPLKSLDLSANKKLKYLTCNATDIATIDLRDNDSLLVDSVDLIGNKLISIHSNSDIGKYIYDDKQRQLDITVSENQTSYDLKNIDPAITAEYIKDLSGGEMQGTIVKNIYDGMKITYTYTESGADLHASIVFHKDETTVTDPSDDQESDIKDENVSTDDNTPQKDKTSPNTGDYRSFYHIFAVLVLMAAAVIFTYTVAYAKKDHLTNNR